MKTQENKVAISFAQKVKKEILSKEIHQPCCAKATAYGFFCFSKKITKDEFLLHTETLAVAQIVKKLFQRLQISGNIQVLGTKENPIYEFAVRDQKMLQALYQVMQYEIKEPALSFQGAHLQCEHCVNHFTAGAFLSCGTMTNPSKEYNLEFISHRFRVLQDFAALLMGHGFTPKITTRKGSHILYFKASEQIEDILTLMGATNCAMEIMSTKVLKDFRNKANRITNCETANIDKTITSNTATLQAISYLRKEGAIEALTPSLQEAVRVREQFPHLALKELSEQFNPPLSKSGISHRMKKIEQIAARLKERKSHG